MIDIYQGYDPREIPAYTLPDAAHLAGVKVQTLRSWVNGRNYPTQRGIANFPALIDRPKGSQLLSFVNVVEAHVLAALRHSHGVPLKNIRAALDYVQRQLNSPHPLAERIFETDGVDLFIRQFGEVVNASQGGQVAIRDFIEAYLSRIEHDKDGHALKFFPFMRRRDDLNPQQMAAEPKIIVVDPRLSFGRPVIAQSGIPTIAIADRFQAGESISSIAKDYDRNLEEIEAALRYEYERFAA